MKLFNKKKAKEQEKVMSEIRNLEEKFTHLTMTIDLCSRNIKNIDKRVERNREWVVNKFDDIYTDTLELMKYKIERLENIVEYSRDGEIVWRRAHGHLYLYIDREEYRVDGLGCEIHINPDDEHEIFFDENWIHLIYEYCGLRYEFIIDYRKCNWVRNCRPVEETCEEISEDLSNIKNSLDKLKSVVAKIGKENEENV